VFRVAKIEREAGHCVPPIHAHGRAILVELEMPTVVDVNDRQGSLTWNVWEMDRGPWYEPEIPPTATLRLVLSWKKKI
jgi:hypothetical protein